MKKKRSKLISMLLTLVMTLSLVPAMGVTASAATGDGTEGNPLVVTTYEEWKDAMQQSGETYIKLGADIDTSTMNSGFGLGTDEWIRVQADIHLNLNGHKLTLLKSKMSEDSYSYLIGVLQGSLTIEDTGNSGEIVGLHQVTNDRMQLIDVGKGAKLTLNSGKLHLEVNADSNSPNATIRFKGAVEINGGTVSILKKGGKDETSSYIYKQNFALEAIRESDNCCALINGGTLDGRVLLKAVAKASGVADNVITGGDFKKSIYILKDKAVTGDVPLNVSIQGGTYHYTPGYYTFPNSDPYNAGKKSSDPFHLIQFATFGFRDGVVYEDGAVYSAFPGGSSDLNYDMNAFASMFPKNAIITAEGQTYDFYDTRKDAPTSITVSDAAFTGSSSALDLARLVNSHYKTITVTTLPSDALKDMTLTVGSDGTPLPANGTSTVSGDVALGSDGTLAKTVYITARGNKQLKEMYYSNPSKIDFGYRLNIFKNGTPVTDYTGDSLTYAASGDEISVSVQLRDFEFKEGVYTFRLALWPYLRGSEAQIGGNLIGLWKLTAKENVDLPIDSVTLNVPKLTEGAKSGGNFTLSGTNTGVNSTINTTWENIPASGTVAGNFYTARITLTAEEGYAFNTGTKVKLNGDYLSTGSGINDGGAGMTIYVNVPVRHEHDYGKWQIAGNGNVHFRNCSCGVQESKPHEWEYLEGKDKYKCTVCGYEIDGEKERITYVYASPRSPIDGESPGDYTPAEWVKIGGANYKVDSIVWKDMSDNDVTTFEAGKIYKGTVTFKADTGFAFDGDRIYASKIFNSSNAEVVGNNYTLADGGTTLTATFKLKDENVVRPGLNVKVKLPTLNDKIGKSLPEVELVNTTLPENVKFMCNVYENDISTEVTDPNYKVKSNQKYFYLVWLKSGDSTDITEITKTYNVSYEVTDGGDAETYTDLVGYGVLAMYQTPAAPDTSKINSVALTVTAPKYGEVPATTATGADDTLYTVGEPTWTPEVTDGKFGAAAYTVSIPVTAADGYSFDANCFYTINGYVATYADDKVSYTFPKLTVPHEHNYTGQPWQYLDPGSHYQACKDNDGALNIEAHTFGNWEKVDGNTHKATCSKCNHEKTENHSWNFVKEDAPTLNDAGTRYYNCSANGCTATKNESIPKLTAISMVNVNVTAPIKDAVPGTATTMDSAYNVAATDWEPSVSTFAGGTKYTVKVSLETVGNNRFTNATAFQINGQTVKPVDTIPATGLDNTIITLTFPATEGGSTGGSTGGSSGGGGGGGVTKYAVTVSPADNGKVTPDKTSAAKGSVVTITAMANDGYALDTIKATDKAGKEIKLTDKGDGKYTFTMPASKVEVKAAFKQTASKPGKPAEEMKTVVVMQVGSKTMFVNGKAYEKDAAPVIMNDRTLVPIRFVTESLGGTVAWNAETKEVTLVIDGKEIKMTIGKTIEKYGVAPVIIDSRTFVPVRFVADELGATTAWNAETKTVTITKAVTPVKTEK